MPFKKSPSHDTAPTETSEPDCFDSVKHGESGRFLYARGQKECPEPTPQDRAKAALEARKNLLAFGEVWCEEGRCPDSQCRPVLSQLTSEYTITSEEGEHGLNCYVVATLRGTISCQCG